MKNKHAKFGGPSYNSFWDICVTGRMTENRQNDRQHWLHTFPPRIGGNQQDYGYWAKVKDTFAITANSVEQ